MLTPPPQSNLFPVMLPFYLTNAHFSCAMCFFCSLLMDTTITHSGYNVPYLINALKHDWHHCGSCSGRRGRC